MIALIHDVLIVLCAFLIFAIPLNDAFVAVVLTIIGYSINDTIVIYDRIRENMNLHKCKNIDELVDTSVSQSLGRSLHTSLTTCISVLILGDCIVAFLGSSPFLNSPCLCYSDL